MGGITSTRRAEVMADNCRIDDDLIPKKPLGSHAGPKAHGSHVFEILGYSLHRELFPANRLVRAASAVFAVGGYDWQIVFIFFPQGHTDLVAAFLVLKSKDKDIRVRASFHLSLVDVTGSVPPYTMSGANEFDPERSVTSGSLAFKKRSEIEASPYLRDDRLTVECAITVEDVKTFAEVPPSNTMGLAMIFEDTDVIFEVGGEDFPAHKTVLAMRSPVFKAELYGAMRENEMNRIAIGDMQPVVFEALLDFIYTDSLPAMDDLGRNDYYETIRHLLVAADQYAIDNLKIICESILCESIDVTTVMTTLALADQHHCSRLNDACLQFIGTLGRVQMDDVMASQWYAELKASSPLALVELWEKACKHGKSKSSFHFGSLVA
ncbi:unnamed protein product [Alopecurus aequalis]